MPENEDKTIDPNTVLHGILDGPRSHTRDGETVTDYSVNEKIAAIRELERRNLASQNPFAAIRKVVVPLNSMQE